MKILDFEDIPQPKGHYSTCIEHGGVLYLSGLLPKDLHTGEMPEGIEDQCMLVLTNMQEILKMAGSEKNKVIRVRIYLPDVELWGTVNEIYAGFFASHKPARVVVPSRDLHYGALIELEATAAA